MARCRQGLCSLIGGGDPNQIVLTLNCTDALSLAIEGTARSARRQGRAVHIVTTDMDHNSVLRPLRDLEADGVRSTRVPADPVTGLVDPRDVAAAVTKDTRLVAINHGSNVSGSIQPLAEIGAACRRAGVPLLVDAAQTIGHRDVDVDSMGIDLLAFPGHKGLLGPLGTGGLWIRPGHTADLAPVRLGGTGSRSELDVQPTTMPDRYESGSHNMPGIVGLDAALQWILSEDPDTVYRRDSELTAFMLERLLMVDTVSVLGPTDPDHRCGVFSVVTDTCTPAQLAERMEAHHGILGRHGIHCAPAAHRTFGTLQAGGAFRLSIGPMTTLEDVEAAVDGLAQATSCTSRVAVPA
jgi:selenocysteine lyase/cysteine desulfurase